uniref:Uncharacterized protein n=1 Tax=Avena sativa TaxID=4498 RepID=A0ACD5V9N8_AVESA
MDPEPLDVGEQSDFGDVGEKSGFEPTPLSGEEMATPQIPPHGSGARLGATSCSSQAPSESVNYISDDEEDEVVEVERLRTRKLTSDVWNEMTKKKVNGQWKGIFNYCNKPLSAEAKSGTTHLRDHLKTCTQRMIKLNSKGGKSLSQASLRMTAQPDGKMLILVKAAFGLVFKTNKKKMMIHVLLCKYHHLAANGV